MLTHAECLTLVAFIPVWCVRLTMTSEKRKILFALKQLFSRCTSWLTSPFISGKNEKDQAKGRKILAEQITNPLIGCIWRKAFAHTVIMFMSYQFFSRGCLTSVDLANWIVSATPDIAFNGMLDNLVQLLRLTVLKP